jgi:hypothetical protein
LSTKNKKQQKTKNNKKKEKKKTQRKVLFYLFLQCFACLNGFVEGKCMFARLFTLNQILFSKNKK